MSLINTLRFFIIILLYSSCTNDKNEKYYKIENINENDIIQNYIDIYDTNKMIFVKGGRLILVVTMV